MSISISMSTCRSTSTSLSRSASISILVGLLIVCFVWLRGWWTKCSGYGLRAQSIHGWLMWPLDARLCKSALGRYLLGLKALGVRV